MSLKTTGFPSPEVKIAVVTTVYPGASANTVLEQVTKPIEVAIKGIDGVENYVSNSNNNFSTIAVTISDSANADSVRTKIDSAVKSVVLPTGANAPSIFAPKVGSDEYYYAITAKDDATTTAEMYNAIQIFKTKVEKNSDVNGLQLISAIDKKIVITIDQNKLFTKGISQTDITNQIQLWGLAVPVTQNAEIDGKTTNMTLTISGKTLDEFKDMQITSSVNPRLSYKLKDLVDVSEKYITNGDVQSYIAFKEKDKNITTKGSVFTIDVSDKADLTKYDTELQKVIKTYFDSSSDEFKALSQSDKDLFSKFGLVKVYSVADSNKEQVNEVVSGLIGSKQGEGIFSYAGFILGGIELVFLAMLLFVSWRAAAVSALAIPLSFFFSTIVVKATGNDLNTLVLFSLVLVIGLVVDPALVVLESIQRNLDNGFKGKEAVLKAVDEIGGGLLMAVLTSVLVFVPFGIVSGIFGQIISYIPLTILPALVGSYVVPLVFLTWIGSFVLKRSKSSHHAASEEETLWPVARWMIKINEFILNTPAIIQFIIVVASVAVPVAVAGYFISTKQVKFVQFAEASDADRITVSITRLPQNTLPEAQNRIKDVTSEVITNDNVEYVAPFDSVGLNQTSIILEVGLKPKADRKVKANKIAEDIARSLDDKFKGKFFDITVAVEGVGVPTSAFPIALAIKNVDAATEKRAAEDITKILNSVCKDSNGTLLILGGCSDSKKLVLRVDNGFNSQQTDFIEIKLDRSKLLANPVQPFVVKSIIASQFSSIATTKIATLVQGEQELDIVIANEASGTVKSVEDIKNILIPTLTGKFVKLSAIADISTVESLSSIRRVKGETVGLVNAKPVADYTDQSSVVQIQTLVLKEFNDNYKKNYPSEIDINPYSEGTSASITKSFSELGLAFLLAIVLTYIVLVIFFNSLTQPLVILFSIPLTFLGIFPSLAAFGGGQLGFLEIIGIIILVGLVENVGIFLMDAANQKVREGWDKKKAIAYASGVRFRPIFLTKVTTLVSTAPLAILSEQYRSLSVVVIFGLLASGFISLFISPILYVFFKNVSEKLGNRVKGKPKAEKK